MSMPFRLASSHRLTQRITGIPVSFTWSRLRICFNRYSPLSRQVASQITMVVWARPEQRKSLAISSSPDWTSRE